MPLQVGPTCQNSWVLFKSFALQNVIFIFFSLSLPTRVLCNSTELWGQTLRFVYFDVLNQANAGLKIRCIIIKCSFKMRCNPSLFCIVPYLPCVGANVLSYQICFFFLWVFFFLLPSLTLVNCRGKRQTECSNDGFLKAICCIIHVPVSPRDKICIIYLPFLYRAKSVLYDLPFVDVDGVLFVSVGPLLRLCIDRSRWKFKINSHFSDWNHLSHVIKCHFAIKT